MLLEGLVAIVVGVAVWLVFFREEEHPVDKLPSPPCHPFIGNTLEIIKITPENLLSYMIKYTKEYGDRYVFKLPLFRVLHIVRPSDIEVVMTHSKNIKKSMPYEFLADWLGNGLLLSTGTHWHKRRKILTPTFHFNILKNFATVFEEKTVDLVKMLKETKSEPVDLMPVISDFTLFTICETAMGTKLDGDQSATTKEYKSAIANIGILILERVPRLWLYSDFIFNRTGRGKKFRNMLKSAQTFADNVIMERKAKKQQDTPDFGSNDGIGAKRRLAMLDLLFEVEEKGEIDMQGIRDEVNTFMFEGHDTTAAAITFCLMLLADHEEIQERIYEEVQNIVGHSGHVPTMSELAEMKFLEAVIKETLRLYPSVPFIGRQIIEDFMMGDILVKKGTTVDLHIYELHHREDMFPNPEAFDPDRFLGTEMRHPYAYVPFSAGPRNCIGQKFAMQEMKCTISEICRNFKLVPKTKGARPRMMVDLVLRPIDPIYIKFVQR